jgi:hypothetical protein
MSRKTDRLPTKQETKSRPGDVEGEGVPETHALGLIECHQPTAFSHGTKCEEAEETGRKGGAGL